MPNGLVVAFKLGGKAQLPSYTPVPLDKPSPSSERFTSAQIATGNKFYFTYCTICHGGPVNPDLRRSTLLQDRDAWRQVVIDGVLAQNGMVSFAANLGPEEAEGIRAYLNQQAKVLLQAEGAKPD
jgi:mono/diheme cytochrome c family protein